jgi:hypothetical protein
MLEMHNLRNRIHGRESHRPRLSVLLSSCRTANATCAVDKIYVLLELSSDFADFPLNYYISKAQVYMRFAMWHIYKKEGKELLYEAVRSDRASGDLPSWIPDWSEVPTRMNLEQQWSRTGKWLFSAGGAQTREGPKESIRMETDKVLSIKGFIVQTILILGYPEDRGIEGAPNLTHLLNVISDVVTCKKRMATYPTGENVDFVMDRVIEADQPRDRQDVTSFWDKNTA